MEITVSTYQLKIMLQAAASLGAKVALASTGKMKPYLTKAECFRLCGRKNIERWINEGLLTPRKDGDHSASWRIDRLELEALVLSNEILRFL